MTAATGSSHRAGAARMLFAPRITRSSAPALNEHERFHLCAARLTNEVVAGDIYRGHPESVRNARLRVCRDKIGGCEMARLARVDQRLHPARAVTDLG